LTRRMTIASQDLSLRMMTSCTCHLIVPWKLVRKLQYYLVKARLLVLKDAQFKPSKVYTSVRNVVLSVDMCLLAIVSIAKTVMMISLVNLLSMIKLDLIMNNRVVIVLKLLILSNFVPWVREMSLSLLVCCSLMEMRC
jgi:hypothetical protein